MNQTSFLGGDPEHDFYLHIKRVRTEHRHPAIQPAKRKWTNQVMLIRYIYICILKWVVLYGGKKRVPGLPLKIKFGSFYDDSYH